MSILRASPLYPRQLKDLYEMRPQGIMVVVSISYFGLDICFDEYNYIMIPRGRISKTKLTIRACTHVPYHFVVEDSSPFATTGMARIAPLWFSFLVYDFTLRSLFKSSLVLFQNISTVTEIQDPSYDVMANETCLCIF